MVGQGRFANKDTGIGSEKMSKNDPGNKVEKATPSKKNNEPNKKPEAANPHACMLDHIRLFVTLWTVSCQDPLSVGFFRQEYWIGSLSPPTQKSNRHLLCLLHCRQILHRSTTRETSANPQDELKLARFWTESKHALLKAFYFLW